VQVERYPVRRHLINYIERVLTWVRKGQTIIPPPGVVKLNLGSGLHVAPGWINVDGSLKTAIARWPQPLLRAVYPWLGSATHPRDEFVEVLRGNRFVMHNLKYGVPLPSSSVDFVFASHVLHHLYKSEARELLIDIARVMKSGGTLRICVPDLEYIIGLYERGERERAIEGHFFYPSPVRSELSSRHYQYDFVMLKDLLERTGFTRVRRCTVNAGTLPDLDKLDRLSEESLYVETTKP
jgi:SAM-dependent methyltransferase